MTPGRSGTNIQVIKLTPEQQERLGSHFKTRFQAMKTYRDILDVLVVKWLKLYNAKADTKQYAWQSNVFVPYIFSLIQQLVPRIRDTLFGAENFIGVEAHTEQFLHLEQTIGRWMAKKLRKQGFQQKARDVILESFKYPIGILKARWVEETKKKKAIVLKYGFLPTIGEVEYKVGHCETDIIPYWDFWWDPEGTSERSCKDYVHRVVRDRSYVKAMIQQGKYQDCGEIPDNSYPDDSSSVKQEVDIYESGKDGKRRGYSECEIMEHWCMFDVNNDGNEIPVIVTHVNQSMVVRCERNTILDGVKPFGIIKPLVEANQFTGMPPIKMAASSQNELNTVKNQRIDNRNLMLRKIFKAKKDADIDVKEVMSGPGQVMWLYDMDDIKEIEVKDVSTTAVIEENVIKQDMQIILGTTDNQSMPDSATGASLMASAVASRYQDMIMNLRTQFEDFIKLQFAMIRQFSGNDEVFRFKNPDTGEEVFQKITPKDLDAEYDLSLVLKSQVDTAAKQNGWLQLLNVLGKYPGINIKAFVRNILEAYEVKNIDEIMRAPEPAAVPGMPGAPGANPTVPEPLNPQVGMSALPESPVKSTPQIAEAKSAMEQATSAGRQQ